MRRRHTCLMTTVMVTMGLLVLGQTATATDQLLGAMGMVKLPYARDYAEAYRWISGADRRLKSILVLGGWLP
jgi:hypothetical protein